MFKIRAGDRAVNTDKTVFLRFTSHHDVIYEIAAAKTKNVIRSYRGIVKVADWNNIGKLEIAFGVCG